MPFLSLIFDLFIEILKCAMLRQFRLVNRSVLLTPQANGDEVEASNNDTSSLPSSSPATSTSSNNRGTVRRRAEDSDTTSEFDSPPESTAMKRRKLFAIDAARKFDADVAKVVAFAGVRPFF